jgi:carbamoyl-phosphate synthase large subunit
MKATGEIMAIGLNFEQAIMKSVCSIELGLDTLNLPKLQEKADEEIRALLHNVDDERIFVVYAALKRGITPDEILRSPASTAGSFINCRTSVRWRRPLRRRS